MAARTAIGLDIGACAVRAAELSFAKTGVTLEKFGEVALPDGAVRGGEVVDSPAVSAAVRQLWSSTRFSHKNVVIGVANQRVIVRSVELAWLPMDELKSALPLQVQEYLPMPVDTAVLDFHPLEQVTGANGARQLRGLLVAAAKDMVMSNVGAVQSAGLTADVVDLTAFAVLRSLGSLGPADAQTEAVIDVGAQVTNIVVHSGGSPRFVRILLMGGHDVTDAVAERLGVPQVQAEALKQELGGAGGDDASLSAAAQAVESTAGSFVDEVRGTLEYFAASNPGGPVQRVVVSGGGSRLVGLTQRLALATGLPVEIGDPVHGLRLGRAAPSADTVDAVHSLAAVPVGLALGAA